MPLLVGASPDMQDWPHGASSGLALTRVPALVSVSVAVADSTGTVLGVFEFTS